MRNGMNPATLPGSFEGIARFFPPFPAEGNQGSLFANGGGHWGELAILSQAGWWVEISNHGRFQQKEGP